MTHIVLSYCPSLSLTIPVARDSLVTLLQALGDHRNAFRRQAGVKGPARKLSGILLSAKQQERGGHLGSEGIYERREAEEQERLQLVLWSLAAISVSFPIPRLMAIA